MTISSRDSKCIWHPFTQMQLEPEAIAIVKGEGALLIDEQGKSYIDAVSSWWVNLHGHAHPAIIERISAQLSQLEQVMFAGFTHEPAVALGEKLLEILPGDFAKVFYTDNGSTAVEAALKMAVQYWHNKGTARTKIISFKDSYHGDTVGAVSASGRSHFSVPFAPLLFEVIHITAPHEGQQEQSLSELRQALSGAQSDAPAAFIFEPLVQGVAGMKLHDRLGLDALLAECKKHDVITIADEVMTGFGRTGPNFACEFLVNSPDIICLSKGLTGGFMPLGATVVSQKIFDAFLAADRLKMFFHGHSYTANPLACAAALASIELLQNLKCSESRERIAKSHQTFAVNLKSDSRVENVRQLGTILAFDVKAEANTSYTNPIRDRLYHHFLEQGVLLRPLGNIVYVLPPYCITEGQLNQVYSAIETALDEVIQ
jgi:adenosylmethionine---8-amino-7-oxononanoate aminotransferase